MMLQRCYDAKASVTSTPKMTRFRHQIERLARQPLRAIGFIGLAAYAGHWLTNAKSGSEAAWRAVGVVAVILVASSLRSRQVQPGDLASQKPAGRPAVSVAYSGLSRTWQLTIGLGFALSVVNFIFLIATSLAPILNAENVAATLSVQVALLSMVLVFGGFGISVVGFLRLESIRTEALHQAAEQAQVAITKLWADRTSPKEATASSELDESADDELEREVNEP